MAGQSWGLLEAMVIERLEKLNNHQWFEKLKAVVLLPIPSSTSVFAVGSCRYLA